MKCYTIKADNKTIICSSWEECEPHIVSQKNVTVKSFSSLEEAEFSVNFNKVIKVYTDGSCLKNGRQGAVAGIGIYFGRGDSRNVSLPYLDKPTNNRAEMTAILESYKLLNEEISKGERIKIYTDSNYTINCFTKWAGNWEKKGWTKKGGPIKNLELVKKGWENCKRYPNVTLHYVKAHTNGEDEHSLGNAQADRLAVEGSKVCIMKK